MKERFNRFIFKHQERQRRLSGEVLNGLGGRVAHRYNHINFICCDYKRGQNLCWFTSYTKALFFPLFWYRYWWTSIWKNLFFNGNYFSTMCMNKLFNYCLKLFLFNLLRIFFAALRTVMVFISSSFQKCLFCI